MKLFRRKKTAPLEQTISNPSDDGSNDNEKANIVDSKTNPEDTPRQPSIVEQHLKQFEVLHEFDPNLPRNYSHQEMTSR
jgi:hypothetical protein